MKNDKLTRRSFLKYAFSACSMCSLALMDGALLFPAVKDDEFAREAKYYEKQAEKRVTCKLCPHECRVADLERGTCGVRENRGGTYYTLVYGNPCSAHIDPIEKKPMFHYYPTTEALSIATAGCNFVCKFCQNWEISQKRPEQVESMKFFPKSVIDVALQRKCKTVAHTYSEPVVFFEYMLDCAIEGKRRGVPNVMISNGYIQEKPMRELCKYLGAVKVDLKADDRESADGYRGRFIWVDRKFASVLGEEEYYITDLQGCRLFQGKNLIGSVVAVPEGGGGDFLEVESPEGKRLIVPFSGHFVGRVDIVDRRIELTEAYEQP